jgi:hypothetical protein
MVAVFAVISTACGVGNGTPGSVTRAVQGNFTKLKLQSGIQATITIGPHQDLVLGGDEGLLENTFQTQVTADGTLDANLGFAFPSSIPFTLQVQMPAVESIIASGSSKFTATDLSSIEIDHLELRMSSMSVGTLGGVNARSVSAHGSGASTLNLSGSQIEEQIDLRLSGASTGNLEQLSAQLVTADCSGASHLNMDGPGTNSQMEINLSGGSTLKAKDYQVNTGKVDGSGNSVAEVTVTNAVSGLLIRGSQMTVFGNPPTRNVTVEDTSTVTYP